MRRSAGEIDRSTYDKQLARVREDRSACFEKLREADTQEDEKYLDTSRSRERKLSSTFAAN